ncbi:hypothetical protein O6H91_06G134500 [Diphasiastrum complanatum]|uniref:Uncharacterized protein n=1 Tax=Diphasiastrum complanatum TaxID=34168 RepID=A0ACC2DJ49_DIPCM|nr:hypothetical protein O6H91_06G134500 [Diphasiastrum complanatum]
MRGVVERRALTAMLVRARISSLPHHRQSHAFSSSSSSPGGIGGGRGRGRGRGAPPAPPPSGIGHGTVIRERTAAAPAPSPQFGGLGRGVGGVKAAADPSRVAPKASEGFEGVNSKNVDRFDSYYSQQQQQQQSYSNNYGRNESNAAFGRPSGLEDPPSANRGFSDGPEGEFLVYGRQHQNLRNPSVDPQISNEGYYGRPYQNERSAFVDPRTTNEGYYGRQYENEPIRSVDPRIVNQRQYEYERYSSADPRLANEGYSERQYQNERYPPVDPRISSEAYYSRQYQNERYPPVDPRTSREEYYSRQYQNDRYSSADPRTASEEYHRRPYQNGRYPLVDPRIPKEDYYGRPYQNERYPAVDPRTTNEGYYGRQYESGPPLPFDVRQANERFYDRGYQSAWNPSADPRRANEGYASSRHDNLSYEQSGYIPSRRLGGSVPPGVEREQNVRVPEPSGQSPGVYRQPGSVDAVQSQWYGRDSGRPVGSTEAFREETFNRSEQDFAMRRPPIEPADPSQYYNAGPPYSRRVNEDSKSAEYARDETIRMRDMRSRSEAGNLGPAPPQFTTRDHYLASGRDAHGLPDERASFVGMGRGQGPVAGPAGLHARVSGPTSQNLSQQSFPPHLGSGRGPAGRFPREDDIGNMAQPGMGQMTGRFKDTQVDPNSHNPNYYAQTDRHPPFQPCTYDAEQLYSYNTSEAEVRQGENSGTSVRILPTREREQAAERYDRRSIQEEAKQREWSGRAISPQSGSSVRGARTSEYLKAEEFSRKERDPGNIQAPRHADAHQAQTFGRDSSWTEEGSQLPADSSVTAVKDKAHAREQDRRVSQIGSEPAKYVSSKPSERSSSFKSAETGVQVKVSSEPARYVSPISQPLKHLPSINKDSVRFEPSVSAEGASGNVASTTLSLKPSKPGPGILEVGANDSGAILDTTSKLPSSHFHPKPAEFLYPASTTSMERAVVESEFRVATQKTESTILQSTSDPEGTDPVQDIHTPLETTGLAEQRSPAETEFRSSEAVKPDLYPHHLELQGLISKPGFGRGKPVEKARFQDRSTWKLGDMPSDVGKSSRSDTHVVNLSSPDGALAGMGRGKPPSPAQPTTSQQEPKQPHHLQLSREEAAQRALSILEEGIEKTLSEEQRERRRKKFSRPEFSGQSLKAPAATSTEHLPVSKKSKEGRLRPERQREKAVRTAEEEDESVEEELTPEQQEVINVIHNTEDIIKSSLHGRFLVDFEPEYAMEEFGRNPDIEEKPFPSLEETLEQAKHLLMPLEGLTEEKDWQDAVQKVVSNASHLEKLVEAYSGPARVTARQQNIELESIAESLPAYIAPEMKAFTERALITLQVY